MIRDLLSGDAFGLISLRMFFEGDGAGGGGGGGDGDGGGGDGDGGGDGGGDAKFTQADVDRIVTERVRNKDRAIKAKEQELTAIRKELDEIKAQIANPPGGGAPDATKLGEIEILERKYQRQLDELNAKLGQVEKDREAEKNRRMRTERDKELGDALSAVNCQDHIMGRRYFEPQIEWDTVDEKWMYRTKSGNLVNIIDGVTDELPNSLKPPALGGGGSGSGGTPPKRLAKKAELEAAKATLAKMEKAARESRGNAGLVAQWNVQKKIVARLEAEYAS